MRARGPSREERRALGLCTHGTCTQPVEPGCARCSDCLAAVRASSARWRARGGSVRSTNEIERTGDRLGPYVLFRRDGRIEQRRVKETAS